MDNSGSDGALTATSDFAVTHPLRPLVLSGILTLIAYVIGVIAVDTIVTGQVTEGLRLVWTSCAAAFVLAWAVLVGVMWRRRPDPREAVLLWGHASRFITFVSQGLVTWAVWAFFPACTLVDRIQLAGMFMLCSPAQIIAAPENVGVNRLGIIASYGSLALWFGIDGSARSVVMAGFALGIGLMLGVLCNYVPGKVTETVTARLAAEQSRLELAQALAAVADERDAKTRFIAAASHDLGQPLQAANLFFDQTLRAVDPVQREGAIAGVRTAFASAEQLLSHMLNHLRLEADAIEPRLTRFELGPAIGRIAAQFAPAASKAGIALRAVPTTRVARLDRVLFDRALGNLIDNAIKHSGGTQILLGTRWQQNRLRIWVIDDGRGLTEVEAARAFDDYYRGARPIAGVQGGFGLGLASVRRIARLMDGSAGHDPRWTGGAAFYLDYPLGPDPTELLA